jgi:short-subunit dehydrogenase
MPDLKGQVVVVTGASSGIGAATAREFGRAGARVVLAARRVERLETVAQEIRALDTAAEALPLAADLSQLADIQHLVQQTLARFGRIDVLFNNAGFGRLDWLENLDPLTDIEAQYAVNVLGVVQTTRQVLPVMMRQKGGHIINMASMAGWVGTPTYTIYASCKFAVRGFSEALRREAAPWGIKVSVIYPGGVATEFGSHAGIKRKTKATTPKFMLLTAEQVGRLVVGLVRRPRPEILTTWPWYFSAWINQLFPGLVDWTTISRFTVPERSDELTAAGLK